MFENLNLFRLSSALAAHAGTGQAVVAENIANADTPGYKAREVVPFAAVMEAEAAGFHARATRAGHMMGSGPAMQPGIVRAGDRSSNPNGNEVSLEEEMLKAVAVKRQHDKALAIYRSGLTILRSSLGRG